MTPPVPRRGNRIFLAAGGLDQTRFAIPPDACGEASMHEGPEAVSTCNLTQPFTL